MTTKTAVRDDDRDNAIRREFMRKLANMINQRQFISLQHLSNYLDEESNPKCSYPGCNWPAVWKRKEGWMVAPGSPDGNVCEEHHCWEKI